MPDGQFQGHHISLPRFLANLYRSFFSAYEDGFLTNKSSPVVPSSECDEETVQSVTAVVLSTECCT